jgi:hypothetical protein
MLAGKTSSSDDLFEVVIPHISSEGSFGLGQLVRGDHPGRELNPGFFARQADPGERVAALLAVEQHRLAAEGSSRDPAADEPSLRPGFARALRSVTAVVTGPDGAPRSRTVRRGEVVPASDEIVRTASGEDFEVRP